MTCQIERLSPQELFDQMKSRFSVNVLGGADVVPESLEWYVVANDYAMTEQFYSIAEQQWKARDPRYACCDDLIAMAAQDGVYPYPAGFAQGYVKFTGTGGSPLPDYIDVVFGQSTYRVVSELPSTFPTKGSMIARVRAVVPGPDGNNAPASGNGRTFIKIDGVDRTVTSYGAKFCGGNEGEECEAFRQRYINRLAYKPRATDAWLREKILEWPCATRVVERGGECCETAATGRCGCSSCSNTNEYYVFFDDSFECGVPEQCVIDELNDWLWGLPKGRGLGQAEIGVCGHIYRAEPIKLDVTITGLGCYSPAQIADAQAAIARVFKSAVPSTMFTIRSVEIAVAQALGGISDFELVFSTNTASLVDGKDPAIYTPCGDFDAQCDQVPCLGDIKLVDTIEDDTGCP